MIQFKYYNEGAKFRASNLSKDDIAFVEDSSSVYTHNKEFQFYTEEKEGQVIDKVSKKMSWEEHTPQSIYYRMIPATGQYTLVDGDGKIFTIHGKGVLSDDKVMNADAVGYFKPASSSVGNPFSSVYSSWGTRLMDLSSIIDYGTLKNGAQWAKFVVDGVEYIEYNTDTSGTTGYIIPYPEEYPYSEILYKYLIPSNSEGGSGKKTGLAPDAFDPGDFDTGYATAAQYNIVLLDNKQIKRVLLKDKVVVSGLIHYNYYEIWVNPDGNEVYLNQLDSLYVTTDGDYVINDGTGLIEFYFDRRKQEGTVKFTVSQGNITEDIVIILDGSDSYINKLFRTYTISPEK